MNRVTDSGIAIAERFFFALDELKRRKVIRGLQTFTRNHGLNYWNMSTMKKDKDKRNIKVEYLAFLAQDYKVSCEWLLLGDGEMFQEDSPAAY